LVGLTWPLAIVTSNAIPAAAGWVPDGVGMPAGDALVEPVGLEALVFDRPPVSGVCQHRGR
jgi:hypothetical protein